ncbi:hypothetical protein SeMB42_g01869 [Synchytrium endobioticum]|nr:hypothetical protein SeMB42_g01869 [Synchytrium endobioticum]
MNPRWSAPGAASTLNPDGDADVPADAAFVYPDCIKCGGTYKPEVVFFGENLPPERRRSASEWVADASALLCFGTSLTAYSAYRIVKEATEGAIPVVIANLGPTRADALADMRFDEKNELLVPEVLRLLSGEDVSEEALQRRFRED